MAGGLARGNKKKEKKRNGPDPRQQCHLLNIQKFQMGLNGFA
jgi:hypothetical protein